MTTANRQPHLFFAPGSPWPQVQTLKDWPLKLLQSEGRVLLDARGALFGDYYDLALVRFSVADGDDKGKKGSKSASSGGGSGSGTDDERGRDRELPELPKLAFGWVPRQRQPGQAAVLASSNLPLHHLSYITLPTMKLLVHSFR